MAALTEKLSPSGRTFQGGIAKAPLPLIGRALRPPPRMESPYAAWLMQWVVEPIVRKGSLAPHIEKIHGFGPSAAFDAIVAEATKRLLRDERYSDELPPALARAIVDRDYGPINSVVIKAADAARHKLFPQTDAAARPAMRDVDVSSFRDETLAAIPKAEAEAAELARPERERLENAEFVRRANAMAATMTSPEREVLRLLVLRILVHRRGAEIGRGLLSDRDIEKLTGASREKIVSPIRKRLEQLADLCLHAESTESAQAPTADTAVRVADDADDVEAPTRRNGTASDHDTRPLARIDRALGSINTRHWKNYDKRYALTGPGAAAYVPPRESVPVEFTPAGGLGVIAGRGLSAEAQSRGSSRGGGRVSRTRSAERAAVLRGYALDGAARDARLRADAGTAIARVARATQKQLTAAAREAADWEKLVKRAARFGIGEETLRRFREAGGGSLDALMGALLSGAANAP